MPQKQSNSQVWTGNRQQVVQQRTVCGFEQSMRTFYRGAEFCALHGQVLRPSTRVGLALMFTVPLLGSRHVTKSGDSAGISGLVRCSRSVISLLSSSSLRSTPSQSRLHSEGTARRRSRSARSSPPLPPPQVPPRMSALSAASGEGLAQQSEGHGAADSANYAQSP